NGGGRSWAHCQAGSSRCWRLHASSWLPPAFCFLDEPSVGLAPKVIESLFGVLHALKGTGLTIVLAEQHVPLALDLADHAVVLSLGRVALSGAPADLRDSADIGRAYLGG